MIAKLKYIIEVELDYVDDRNKKEIIRRIRQKIKGSIFDSPDPVKPTKIKIEM